MKNKNRTFEEIHKKVCDLLEIERAFKRPYLRKPLLKQQAQQPYESPLLISVFVLQLLLIAILLSIFLLLLFILKISSYEKSI